MQALSARMNCLLYMSATPHRQADHVNCDALLEVRIVYMQACTCIACVQLAALIVCTCFQAQARHTLWRVPQKIGESTIAHCKSCLQLWRRAGRQQISPLLSACLRYIVGLLLALHSEQEVCLKLVCRSDCVCDQNCKHEHQTKKWYTCILVEFA